MKVNEISIENFKGIDSLKFQPRLLNVIVGRNNTGKTSILEAMALVLNSDFIEKNYSETPSAIINYLVDSCKITVSLFNNIKKEISVKIEKMSAQEIVDGMTAAILENIEDLQSELNDHYFRRVKNVSSSLKALKNFVDMDISEFPELVQETVEEKMSSDVIGKLSQECIILRRGDGESFFFGEEFRHLQDDITLEVIEKAIGKHSDLERRILRTSFIRFNSSLVSRIEDNNSSAITKYNEVTLVKDPLRYLRGILEKDKGKQELALEIEKILKKEKIVPNLLRFDFTEIVFETPNGIKSVSFNRMGEGFQALVAILTLLKSINNSKTIFLIEEPEVHMHPGYVIELVKYLAQVSASLNVQIFITSHSYDLIQSLLDESYPEQLKLFLKENLLLLRLTRSEDTVIGENISYDEAKSDISDLQLDLRGV